MTYNMLFAAIYFSEVLIVVLAFVYLVKNNKFSGNLFFIIMLACWFIGALFCGFNYLISNETVRIIFHELKYVGVVPIAPLFLLYIISLFSPDRRPPVYLLVLASVLTFAAFVVIFTNPYHGLFRAYIGVWYFSSYSLVVCKEGILFYVLSCLQWSVYIFALIYLLVIYFKRRRGNLNKIIILIAVMILPIFFYVMYSFGGGVVDQFDYTVPISSIIYIVGILYVAKDSVIYMVPIARSKVFEYVEIPFFVVNAQKIVVDQNEAAIREYSMLKGKYTQDIPLFQTIDICSDKKQLIIHDRKIYECTILPINQEGKNKYYATILQDVTVREAYFEKLKSFTYKDFLTNLYNRRYLFENGEQFIREAESVFVIVADINYFKSYNDTLGHNAGDCVLVKVAAKIEAIMARCGIVCRYGGDEFVALLKDMEESALREMIDRIQQELLEEEIGVAFGYVSNSDPKESLYDMIKRADSLMYTNKEKMKNKNQLQMGE